MNSQVTQGNNNNPQITQMDADLSGKDPQTYTIIGAAMAVHGELGHGFLEAVCQAALEKEFQRRKITYDREKRLPVYYGGEVIAEYQADFLCFTEDTEKKE